MTKEQIIEVLKSEVQRLGSQKALAAKMGISLPYLSDIIQGRREPGPKVLAYLGLERQITYVKVKK